MTKEELHNHIKSVSEDYISKSWNTFLDLDETDLILAGIGVGKIIASEQERRIEELEKKIKKIQDDIDCLTLACENYREEMEKNLADATELEKENAELKERNRELLESCEGATMIYKDLCKAREIIKALLNSCFGYNSKTVNYEVKVKAEQFLKE